MDRNDNPGNVERQMDDAPVEREGMSGGGMDRDSLQGGGPVEREGMQGTGGVERDNLGGGSPERGSMDAGNIDRDTMEGRGNDGMMPASNADGGTSDTMMRADQREGGYGYDRPVDLDGPRDDGGMRGASTDTDRDGMIDRGNQGGGGSDRSIGDRGRPTTGEGISRDW